MAIQLTIAKPLNVSLQPKPLDVTSGFSVPQNGAWDIIYFCRIDNGHQVGDIHRLGKVIGVSTDPSTDIFGDNLVYDNDFQNTTNTFTVDQGYNITGDYWTTATNWQITQAFGVPPYQAMIAKPGGSNFASLSSSTLSQTTTNPLVTPHDGGEYIKTGYTYEVSFNLAAVPQVGFDYDVSTGDKWTLKVGGYTQPEDEIFSSTTSLGVKKVIFTAQSDGLSFIAGELDNGYPNGQVVWAIREINVKQLFKPTDTYAIITVEPDATAQTPSSGDFIFFGKDNQVGTAGVTGYYATIEMKNDSIDYSELFAVSSEITQSSK